jgi:nucleoid-associated protein YgaU
MQIESLYNRCYLIEFSEGDKALYRTPINYKGSSSDRYHIVTEGQTLHSIAQKYYDSQFPWFIIADANASIITDIFDLVVGTSLVIPDLKLISSIYVQS